MVDINQDQDEVGYGRPPKAGQFQKGRSGNPRGRPKGQKNFRTDFLEELNLTIEITEGGTKKKITKQRAIIKRLVNDALSGDKKAMAELIALRHKYAEEDKASGHDPQITQEELDILKIYLKQEDKDSE